MIHPTSRGRKGWGVACGAMLLLLTSTAAAQNLPSWTVAFDVVSHGAVFNRTGRTVDYAYTPTLQVLIDPFRNGTWRTGLAVGPQLGEVWKAVAGWRNSFRLWGVLDAWLRLEVEPGVAIVGPDGKAAFSARVGLLIDVVGLLRVDVSAAYETYTNEVTLVTTLGTDVMAIVRALKKPCDTPGC